MSEDKKNITFRVGENRHEELKIAAAKRRQTVQGMIEDGLRLLLAPPIGSGALQAESTIAPRAPKIIESEKSGLDLREGDREWVDGLLAVLHSGNQDAVSAVTQNIKFFRWSVEHARADVSEEGTGTGGRKPGVGGGNAGSAASKHSRASKNSPGEREGSN